MLILMTIVFLAVLIVSCIFHDRRSRDLEAPIMISGFLGVISFIALILVGITVSENTVIDKKIEMYQQENKEIEGQVSTIVSQFQNHELQTFTGLKNESPITLMTMFPELKSNELVAKQIDVYVDNNKKIRSLKSDGIDASVYRWWLYFGN